VSTLKFSTLISLPTKNTSKDQTTEKKEEMESEEQHKKLKQGVNYSESRLMLSPVNVIIRLM
jgi:hypothetical protein